MIISILKKLRFLFLFIIIMVFCLVKAIEAQTGFWIVTDFFFIALIIISLMVINERTHKIWLSITVLGLLQIILVLMNLWFFKLPATTLQSFLATVFFILMTVSCLRLTLKDETINITTLFGSLSSYLFIGLSFAYLYLMIFSFDNNALKGVHSYSETQAIYFSFITLTTVGFGDIVANGAIMQCLAWMEAFCGQAYLAIFISQLVGRYVAEHQK